MPRNPSVGRGPAEWRNEPMVEPTPREEKLAELAEKAKDVKPVTYSITSTNKTATRVVHDHHGKVVTIPPGETREGVELRPDIAEYLGRGDLTLTAG